MHYLSFHFFKRWNKLKVASLILPNKLWRTTAPNFSGAVKEKNRKSRLVLHKPLKTSTHLSLTSFSK